MDWAKSKVIRNYSLMCVPQAYRVAVSDGKGYAPHPHKRGRLDEMRFNLSKLSTVVVEDHLTVVARYKE